MSFGWSAGDIVSAVKLLYQIGTALRDSHGASSDFQDTISFLETLTRTLEHLNTLNTLSVNPTIATNLREQCDHIRRPLQSFLEYVRPRFERALGEGSKRNKISAAPRKIQWAKMTSKKVKELQGRIATPMAAVGLLQGQLSVYVPA